MQKQEIKKVIVVVGTVVAVAVGSFLLGALGMRGAIKAEG